MDTTRVCSTHGETAFKPHSKYWRCRKCAADAVRRKRKKTIRMLKEELGGVCKLCGYDKCFEALEFHHIDPGTKSFYINSGRTYSVARWRDEAQKCVLLCANCHREVTYKYASLTQW